MTTIELHAEVDGASPWYAGPGVGVGSGGMVRTADWLLDQLPRLGVSVPKGSRLYLARKLISQIHERKVVVDPSTELLLQRVTDAQRTLTEYYLIVRAVRHRPKILKPLLRLKLAQMLGGSEIELSDSNTLARDTQFELFVLSLFLMGGATIDLGEPDLRLLFGRDTVGIAVKRLSSKKQLEKRVFEAAEQIESRHDRGFIAVNIDRFVTEVGGPRPDESVAERGLRYNDSIGDLHALMPQFENRSSIMGVMNFGFSCDWIFGEEVPRYSGSFFRQILRFTDSPDEKEHAERYFGTLGARISNELRQL